MLIVKISRIPNAGKGLFTTSPIKKGDIIVEYEGEKLTWEACEKRNRNQTGKGGYYFYISAKNCVDAQYTPEALARYANDAMGFTRVKGLKNNAEYQVIKGKPYIVATHNIAAGNEICVAYGEAYWEAMKD